MRWGIAASLALILVVPGACTDPAPPPGGEASRQLPAAVVAAAPRDAGGTVSRAPFRVPSESEVTDSTTLASLRRGRALIRHTRDSLPRHVGNALSCANCHIGEGTVANAMPLVGVYARFPQYRARSGHVDLIENRINDCFERSMNGRALAMDGRDMRDMVTYLAFLSRGFPVGAEMEGQGVPRLEPLTPDTASGRAIFAATCAVCHGPDGQGTAAAPPVWGPRSYNIGAGMARLRSAAAFVHAVMPLDRPGSLTPQQAYDVAGYINSQPRPDFRGKEQDWPFGGAPPDAAYRTLGRGSN